MPLYEIDGQHPELAGDAWIAPDAHVIGNVRLGAGVSIWFGAVIRGDNTLILLGDGTNVQEGAMLHSDAGVPLTIGRDCTIGHHAILHGCTLGDRVLIGMGATVLNRAHIADECLVGAGALVTEGKQFGAGSLIVGTPARTARALTAEQRTALKVSADQYVARSRLFAERLRRID